MKEFDYADKIKDTCPLAFGRQGILHLFMFLDAMMFIQKMIAMGRVVCFCEIRRMEYCATVDASASAGFEHVQSMKEFDIC